MLQHIYVRIVDIAPLISVAPEWRPAIFCCCARRRVQLRIEVPHPLDMAWVLRRVSPRCDELQLQIGVSLSRSGLFQQVLLIHRTAE